MLRIAIVDSGSRRRLVVEGKLVEPWAAELKRVCNRVVADLNGRELVVELQNLTVISDEGEKVLLDLINEGVRVRGRGTFTKQVLRQLAHKARGTLTDTTRRKRR